MFLKRVVGLVAGLLGLLGVILCLAGAYAVWLGASRLQNANERAFAAVDRGLVYTQDRVRGVQKRVQQSKVATAEINQKIRDWAASDARDRIVKQLEVEAHIEKVAMHVQTVDSWLEVSHDSLQGVQQVLVIGNALGAQIDPESLDEVMERVAVARSSLQKIEQPLDKVREFVVGKEDQPSRLAEVTKLVARMLLAASEVDTGLENLLSRLDELRNEAEELKARTNNLILLAAVICWTILAWIGAGQLALCRWGLKKVSGPFSGKGS